MNVLEFLNDDDFLDLFYELPEYDFNKYIHILITRKEKKINRNKNENENENETDLGECICNTNECLNTISLRMIVKLIRGGRLDLLFGYFGIVEKENSYSRFLFSLIILFGNDKIIDEFFKKHFIKNEYLWKKIKNNSSMIYGLENICFKLRNRIDFDNIFQLHILCHYYTINNEIFYILKNYYKMGINERIDMKWCCEIDGLYRNMILKNPRISFQYIYTI